METKTKTVAEYRTPKCKVVEFYMNRAFMEYAGSYGEDGYIPGDGERVDQDPTLY